MPALEPPPPLLSKLGERLLADVREDVPGAWERMLDEFGEVVLAVPRRHGLGEADAEDVFQATWIALHRSVGGIRDPGALAAWILTTAKRETWRNLRRRAHLVGGRLEACPDEAGESEDPEQLLLAAERGRLVREGLADLEQRCRELLEQLFFKAGVATYADIAAALQVPVGSIGPTRRRCLGRLAEQLEARGFR